MIKIASGTQCVFAPKDYSKDNVVVLVHMLNPDFFLSQTDVVIFCLNKAVVLVFFGKYYEMLD